MVANATIYRDVLFFLKDFIDINVTDPISATRPTNETFVMTSYPRRPVTYPIITIKDLNMNSGQALGLQSEGYFTTIDMEVRVWANDTRNRDQIAQEIFQEIKDNQIGATGTSQANDLHDVQLISSVNVDSEGPKGNRSKVMTFRMRYLAA